MKSLSSVTCQLSVAHMCPTKIQITQNTSYQDFIISSTCSILQKDLWKYTFEKSSGPSHEWLDHTEYKDEIIHWKQMETYTKRATEQGNLLILLTNFKSWCEYQHLNEDQTGRGYLFFALVSQILLNWSHMKNSSTLMLRTLRVYFMSHISSQFNE